MPTVMKHLPMWACLISVHSVFLSNYKLKYELLIGGIRLMHSFVVNYTKQQTGLDACRISIYCNILPFLVSVLMIISFF